MTGIPEATAIILTTSERTELESLARSTKTEHRLRQRARIVLLAADGMASRAIGRTVGCTTGTASKWRVRYAEKRLGGLDETGDRGAEPKYTAETGKRILALLDQPKPRGYARWSGPLLAAALGDVDVQYVWRFLRAQKIDLAGRKSWCESNDPEFAAKAADVVGLYMAPPENAIVICVDEKPSIQALERTQGYLKMPNGRALGGHSHDYRRNGTTTLFAAFEVATGKVTAAHIAGSGAIRTFISTSRRRGPPGSIRLKSGSRSWKESLCTALPSPQSNNSGSTSMPSSRPTTPMP